MTSQVPEFGLPNSKTDYVLRPGGYAVIFNDAGQVAVASTPSGRFLPGGGQDFAESPEDVRWIPLRVVRHRHERC